MDRGVSGAVESFTASTSFAGYSEVIQPSRTA